jgi:hypothetical protein
MKIGTQGPRSVPKFRSNFYIRGTPYEISNSKKIRYCNMYDCMYDCLLIPPRMNVNLFMNTAS